MKLAIIVGLSFFIVNCSTLTRFFDDSGDELPAGAFRSSASIRAQTVPLPVDIAENILSIQNGKIITSDSAQASAPSVQKDVESVAEPSVETATTKRVGAKPKKTTAKSAVYHPFSKRRKIASGSFSPQSSKRQNYTVRPGDTLMKIAFAKYGDIFRWRDIYNSNRELLKDYNKIEIGSVLVLHGVQFVVIEKNGEPYLIRRGDTLGKISHKIYGSRDQWKSLWHNNRQLIRNPNRIYAGFTIYYKPPSKDQGTLLREPTSGQTK